MPYYALRDKQDSSILSTGRNSTNKEEMKENLINFIKAGHIEAEDEEAYIEAIRKLSADEIASSLELEIIEDQYPIFYHFQYK